VPTLIFRRSTGGQNAITYRTWLPDFCDPIVLFTNSEEPGDELFAHVERFNSFDTDGLIEIRALELSERFPFSSIVAQFEHDILRAAELRDWFGLRGQSYESARAFRDKFHMKILARAGGAEVAEFAAVSTPLHLYRFAAEHGYPCVVKPRLGAGAEGLHVLRSTEDLKRFLQHPLPENYMVETYIDGPMFHVDGLAANQRIVFASAAKYLNGCLGHDPGESYGSALLDPADPLSRRLISKTETLLRSLPLPPDFAFHAEFFVDKTGNILLCEVASRPGGSGIVDAIQEAYGLNLYQQALRRSLGLPIDLPSPRPWSAAGRLWVPPRRGRLQSLPTFAPFDWVVDYRPNSVLGQCWEEPGFCTANLASFTIRGGDTVEVESRIWEVDAWFRSQIQWEEIS